MVNFSKIKKIIVVSALSVVLIIGVTAGVFFSRPPVLIVTDFSFSALYGPERLRQRQREIQISLFRRVIPVVVSEHAGPDMISIAVAEASSAPWAVLFPYRYLAGARNFRSGNPETTVMVMGGRNRMPEGLEEEGIVFVRTDTVTDIYRAGASAAFFADEEDIIIFDDNLLPAESRESLNGLLEDRGFPGELLFRTQHVHIPSFDGIGSIIVTGPAPRALEQSLNIPKILFSWIDPAFTPRTVKLVFDDSPWALAAAALRAEGEGEILIPSVPIALSDRIYERNDFRKLEDIVQEIF